LAPDRRDLVTADGISDSRKMGDLADWLEATVGHRPSDIALFERALTHASAGDGNYERLEFLGDRVLGFIVADWLCALFPKEPEGELSRRLNVLVSRSMCAVIGRALGLAPWMRLGKQARDDGAADSDNVLGDMVEALIGALWLDGGLDPARRFIRKAWAGEVDPGAGVPRHPKSALQEWAAANNRKPPHYEMVARSGPHHAPTFQVRVSIKGVGEANAEGPSKQEAETEAAIALLGQLP
jgi:ribonuclease-3